MAHKYQLGDKVLYRVKQEIQFGIGKREKEMIEKELPCVIIGVQYADDERGGYEYAIARSKPTGWGGGNIIEWLPESKIVLIKED